MKMYKYILQSVEDVNWLALIPLLIFFVFFVSMTIYVIKTSKAHHLRMSHLPLSDDKLK